MNNPKIVLPEVPPPSDRSPHAGPAYFDYSDMDAYGMECYKAALAVQPPAAAPDGWKLMPIMPDGKMVDAGVKHENFSNYSSVRAIYSSMLTAAPHPPEMAQQPIDEIGENNIREEFERQHKGRNLKRHHLRGTYSSATIAALWNQHLRSCTWSLQARAERSKAKP